MQAMHRGKVAWPGAMGDGGTNHPPSHRYRYQSNFAAEAPMAFKMPGNAALSSQSQGRTSLL